MADLTVPLSLALIAVVLALVLVVRHHRDAVGRLREELDWAAAERRRLVTERNGWSDQWAPLLSAYPYDPRRFRFLGAPVEGVQFEDDRVVFVSLGRAPSEGAERVKELVRAGRVEFHEEALTAPPAEAAPAPPPHAGAAPPPPREPPSPGDAAPAPP